MVLEAFLIVPDVPEMLILSSSSAFLSCWGALPPGPPKKLWVVFFQFSKSEFLGYRSPNLKKKMVP